MATKVPHIPGGFHTVTPYLTVKDAARLMQFLQEAFEAEESYRATAPEGGIMHAQMRIGDSMIELSDSNEQWPPMTAALHIYVPDTDAVFARAVRAGATPLFEPADMAYGERSGGVRDPVGNNWYIATRTEKFTGYEAGHDTGGGAAP